MPESTACPHCGGPLDLTDERKPTVRCRYCGQTSRLNAGSPPQAIQATVIRLRPGRIGPLWIVLVVLAIVLTLAGAVLAIGVGAVPLFLAGRSIGAAELAPAVDRSDAGWARERLRFGGEGIGPGLFQDARSIGLDGEGRVYVGEYQGGRIQVFDAQGTFLTQWFVDRQLPLRGMGVARDGTVVTVQGGVITLHDGQSGAIRETLEYGPGSYFDDVALTAEGGMVAAWYANRDDLVVFDAQGLAVRTIEAALSGQTGDSELSMRVAANGLGELYVLGEFHESVFHFDPDGRYQSRFGSQGDEPGQFSAPGSITVDGQGRVYVGDIHGVQVFDGTGRYLGVVTHDGYPFGLSIDAQGDLWVAAGTLVFEFEVPPG